MKQLIKEPRELASSLALGTVQHELLHSREEGLTARVACDKGRTFIVKLWKKPGMRGALRRLTQTGNLDREWKTLNHLKFCGLPVPKAIAMVQFDCPKNGYTDAIVLEDLGTGVTGTEYISQLVEQDLYDERLKFETRVIRLTSFLIRVGVLDSDHTLVNIFVVPSRDVIRIDFEISVIVRFPMLHRRRLARMVAGLMASYVIATHSHCNTISNSFAMKLASDLKLPATVLRRSKYLVRALLEKQQEKSGLNFSWNLPW